MDQQHISSIISNTSDERGSRIVAGAAAGLIVAGLLVVALTVGGELYAPLKNWLKATFYHHWVGKGALASLAFVLFTIIGAIPTTSTARERGLLIATLVMTTLSALTLIIFFAYEAFLTH